VNIERRIRWLEREIGTDADGFPPCGLCKNGTAPQAVVRVLPEHPEEPGPPCPGCGRKNAIVINYLAAKPREQPGPTPT
jgi:hypothetical protein